MLAMFSSAPCSSPFTYPPFPASCVCSCALSVDFIMVSRMFSNEMREVLDLDNVQL
jgi:hypothetical protein